MGVWGWSGAAYHGGCSAAGYGQGGCIREAAVDSAGAPCQRLPGAVQHGAALGGRPASSAGWRNGDEAEENDDDEAEEVASRCGYVRLAIRIVDRFAGRARSILLNDLNCNFLAVPRGGRGSPPPGTPAPA